MTLKSTEIFGQIKVASSDNLPTKADGFQNITGSELIDNLKKIKYGQKDGSHFLRTSLKTDASNMCLSRSDKNTENLAHFFVIDCDKRIDVNGEEVEGAPCPHQISKILRDNNIVHILYGSFSHYVGNKGNRYRIIIPTNKPYNKEQLRPTVEKTITFINCFLDEELLVNAKENNTWSQPWYYPRKPANSNVDVLYLEHLNGKQTEVVEPVALPPTNKLHERKPNFLKKDEIWPIHAFNEQYPIADLLIKYGYKKKYSSKDDEKWLRPGSTSGSPGITVRDNKLFSHHDDLFNDGYWHDAFDLYRISEGLSEKEAVKIAAQTTLAPGGRSVDEHNKSLARQHKQIGDISSNSIVHNEILNQLLDKIEPVNFREIAQLGAKGKLKSHHFYVITIETILEFANKNNWGLCRNHDFIYIYNGTYWNLIDEDELKAFLGKAAEKMTIDKFSARYFNFRDQLYKQFLALSHLPEPKQPKNIIFVNLKNGTFEITPTSTRLTPFNRDNFLTYQLPFEYDPNATAPLFEKYLNKVLPDEALQNILSEYLGYVFIRTSTLKMEKTLLLFGRGANGKSVFYEISRHLLGEQNISEYSLQNLTDENGYSRAMIANKLLNYASEINNKLGASIFKQLVSGEPVEARLPYGKPFIITDYAKLIFNCNELPKDVEQSEAYFRRFLIIPFNVTIPENEQDKQLASKIIAAELSGVFNWVLDGLKRLIKQKQFTESEIVRDLRSQYEKESDSVRLFVDECGYEKSSTGITVIKELYKEYRTFCMDGGFYPLNKLNFSKRLQNLGIDVLRRNYGNVAFITKTAHLSYSAYSQASGR